jgi:hypothetical protein
MFAKLAKLGGFGRRHAAPSTTKAAYANDNRPGRRLAAVARRAPRRVLARQVLVCGWRPGAATGRLECFWRVVPIDAAAADEPGISWMIGRTSWLRGTRNHNGHHSGAAPLCRRYCKM